MKRIFAQLQLMMQLCLRLLTPSRQQRANLFNPATNISKQLRNLHPLHCVVQCVCVLYDPQVEDVIKKTLSLGWINQPMARYSSTYYAQSFHSLKYWNHSYGFHLCHLSRIWRTETKPKFVLLTFTSDIHRFGVNMNTSEPKHWH